MLELKVKDIKGSRRHMSVIQQKRGNNSDTRANNSKIEA